MSKVLEAECEAGVVTIEDLPIAESTILSEGVGSSEGIAILQDEKVFYIPNATPDLKLTIEKAIDAINQIAQTLTTISGSLTAIGAGMTGPTTSPPPTLPVDVAQILTDTVTLMSTATELETLKGMLR